MQLKFLLIVFAFISVISSVSAQQKLELAPCGTQPYKSQWLKNYQKHPEAYKSNLDTIIYVPISVHLVGTDAGEAFYSVNKLLDAFCRLNTDFAQAKIQFFLEGDIHYINNSAFYAHETVLQGAEFMLQYNVPNTLNCYVVSDPAGNCGYNLPYAGIALAMSCIDPEEHTWAHEVGHALSLPHPFLGWEGKTYSYSTPTPTTVTYDYTYFHDTPVWNPDTMIIDTTFVELMDGSNCSLAADGFCDTRPDYISYRWECNTTTLESLLLEKDPNEVNFHSDATLFMGYPLDECSNRFSDQQIAAMRANLYNEKPNYLYNQTPLPDISSDPISLVSPVGSELVQYDDVHLDWSPITNATHYFVQVSRNSSFIILTNEYITESNSLTINNLANNKTYYWRVRAFNKNHFCGQISDKEIFKTAQVSGVNPIVGLSHFKVYPTIVENGEQVTLSFNLTKAQSLHLNVYSTTGEILYSKAVTAPTGASNVQVPMANLPKGLYMVGLESNEGMKYEKVLVK